MKIILSQRHQHAASLVTVLVACGIVSMSIAGYLALITQQSQLSARSQTWNMAIAISEAGVEEGLEHLNSNSADLGADNWNAEGPIYSRTRTFPDGNSYTVTIDNTQPISPTITSRAYISTRGFAQNRPQVFVAAAGINLGASQPLTRAVRVTTSRSGLFLAAMVAKKSIDLNGNGILTDSFDSTLPALSTNGKYDPAKAGDLGDVASNAGIIGVVSVQNANIYGHVHTGPGGTATVGSQGAVGSHAWQSAGNKGIQPGWATEDANFTFPDTTAPYSTGLPPLKDQDIVSPVGVATNVTYVNGTPTFPLAAPSGYTLSPIVTNSATITSTVYPGSKSGMITNTSYNTVTTYPGAIPGLVTNYASFTTVSSYPGPTPGLTTNYNGSGKKIMGYSYATSFNYTYPTYAYRYPELTYSYNLYSGTIQYATNHFDYVLQSGDYYATELTGKVYVGGKARLVLPNGLNMSGNDQFVLGMLGHLTMYVGGNSLTVGGNGVLNPNGFAGNFIVYAAPSVTTFTLNGNGEFTGVIVAPNAHAQMNGGGNAVQDFIGALMVNSVKMNGHFQFHYDEALARMPATGRFLITSWDEIK
ncbi:MAG TPA: collagen-binding domain-containing protein [Verrucomicrobiae bacterium]|nr:collagen-binding domain-containing protein [Verrucomicrobiae bacterium]